MSFRISVSGAAADAVRPTVPGLVSDLVASGITAQDPEPGWTECRAVTCGPRWPSATSHTMVMPSVRTCCPA